MFNMKLGGNLDQTVAFIEKLQRDFADFEEVEAAQAAAILDAAIREEAPGALGEKIEMQLAGNRAAWLGPQYAAYVQSGTRPHWILPVNAKALHFFIGSEEIFTDNVYHPGSKPNPFVSRAVDRAAPEMMARFGERVTNRIIGGIDL